MPNLKEINSINNTLEDLVLISGLSGHETKVRDYLKKQLKQNALNAKTDVLGNLICTLKGNEKLPSVILFAHMDQLGFMVKKIEDNGYIRVERVGGVPEKALLSQDVVIVNNKEELIQGVIGNKAHHATQPNEKYTVHKANEIYIDAGFKSKREVLRNGVNIGSPITYAPYYKSLKNNNVCGSSIDDRAGCAVILNAAKALTKSKNRPTVHIVFSVQEEFNLRGVLPVINTLKPNIAIQVDLTLTSDTPDMVNSSDVYLGKGPCVSLFSFHGRGTLNGVIPHPSIIEIFEKVAKTKKINLQRSVASGILTDASYVQFSNEGIASTDVGFPMRYSHSSREVCNLNDLIDLKNLLVAVINKIDKKIKLIR